MDMDRFDFIIVGSGPSGSVVAARLANTFRKPSVLLLEAGGSNNNLDNLSATARFDIAFGPNSPLNWGYKTTPQTQLNGQEIDYSRGKGIGGSSAVNFCGWVVGAKDDYDEWARVVRDRSFSWEHASECLKRIECLHPEIPQPNLNKYVKPKDHSTEGKIHLTFGESWVRDLEDIYVAAEQADLPLNRDVNSGDPIGMGMASVCIHEGKRLTSAIAYLSDPPNNLRIVSNAQVARILIDLKKAVGVELIGGRKFYARKEVVISAGALNTPQILLLSGIGSGDDLRNYGIPVTHELPLVGKNLQDHCFSPVGIVMRSDERTSDTDEKQSPTPMGWFKLDGVLSSDEYEALPDQQKKFLQRPTVPSMEIATHLPPTFLSHNTAPGTTFLGAMCLVMNPQSRGTVKLQSTDPSTPPLIDPQFLTHQYDRRVMVEGVRKTIEMLTTPIFERRTIQRLGPENSTDEAIWEHVRLNTGSSWHMSCTVKMGTNVMDSCVDSQFRVFGIEALRVVDLSVCPFVPNNHTQSTAYVVGEIAAEKLIAQYDLETKEKLDAIAML